MFGFAGSHCDRRRGVTSAYTGYTYWTDFQGMFAATAATIVSGAVAERTLSAYAIFTAVYVALVYPFVGSWKWGGGWLNDMGFP